MRHFQFWPKKNDWPAWLVLEGWLFHKANHTYISVSLNDKDDRGICFGLGIRWLFNFWVTLDFDWMVRFLPQIYSKYTQSYIPINRTFAVKVFDWTIWFECWHERYVHKDSDPWWMHFSWNWKRGWKT